MDLRTNRTANPSNGTHGAPGLGLGRMRRRCMAGASVAAAGYAAALTQDVIWPAALRTPVETALEGALLAVGMLLGLVAVVTWVMTEHVDYMCALWCAVDRGSKEIQEHADGGVSDTDRSIPRPRTDGFQR